MSETDDDDFFLMANLRPADTGLPKVTFSVSRAIERQTQKVDCFRAVPAAFARVFLREPTKLDQLGLGRLERQAELA